MASAPVYRTEYVGGALLEWHRDESGGIRAEFVAQGGPEKGRTVRLLAWPTARRWSWGIGPVVQDKTQMVAYSRGCSERVRATEAAERAAALRGWVGWHTRVRHG